MVPATAEVLLSPEPEPDPEEPQSPSGATALELDMVTSVPGSGNMTSASWVTAQPLPALPTLATNMSGRLLRAEARLAEEPVILTAAQFMYISRLPVLLNHVQAKIASPAGVSLGTVKSKDPPDWRGQLPMYEWMTFQVLPLSKESEA